MAYIQRANVILEVDDSQVGYYTNLGYNLIDAKGNIIQKAKSNDVHTLQQELDNAEKKIAELNAEISRLSTVIINMQKSEKEIDAQTKFEEPVKTTRKKKGAE